MAKQRFFSTEYIDSYSLPPCLLSIFPLSLSLSSWLPLSFSLYLYALCGSFYLPFSSNFLTLIKFPIWQDDALLAWRGGGEGGEDPKEWDSV